MCAFPPTGAARYALVASRYAVRRVWRADAVCEVCIVAFRLSAYGICRDLLVCVRICQVSS